MTTPTKSAAATAAAVPDVAPLSLDIVRKSPKTTLLLEKIRFEEPRKFTFKKQKSLPLFYESTYDPLSSSSENDPLLYDADGGTGDGGRDCVGRHHVLLLREAHVSLELLNPDPNCRSRKSTPVVAIVNVIATVCGGGVLSLPLAFARAGILPTTALMIYAALTTDFTLDLLVASARRTGGRSYGDVAMAAFGSWAQVVTTTTLALMLLGTTIAYQVLVRDIWSSVLFGLFPALQVSLEQPFLRSYYHHGGAGTSYATAEDASSLQQQRAAAAEQGASNLLLAGILVATFPLTLKTDLHALRHTCYVGFSSCILLGIAVVYRGGQAVLGSTTAGAGVVAVTAGSSDGNNYTNNGIKWYSTDVGDFLFAFPIVALCFFCSYNVLGVHSQLMNPTRKRVRRVLDISMGVCFGLFFAVGLGGYLYAGRDTRDNILLNFDFADPYVLAGRTGYCFTLMFGLPLVFLPWRESVLSLPGQVAAWRRDDALVDKYQKVSDARERGAHLVINGVDFDGDEPVLVSNSPSKRHGATLTYGSSDDTTKTGSDETLSTPPTIDDSSSRCNEEEEEKQQQEEEEKEQQQQHHHHHHHHGRRTCRETVIHVGSTVVLLVVSYGAAVVVPGVATVWSIFGSSMAIFIAFIVPAGCYLKIREHKGLTQRSFAAYFILIISCVAAIVCTRQAVAEALLVQQSSSQQQQQQQDAADDNDR